ncbi:MAG: Flp pilus assembly complex ATPase component TadA [Candidatus Omnitrophica bacterium]|nr:Flp pilus assembly complex ATPase component TadA [Candidatus Omnitrophota bacterium]
MAESLKDQLTDILINGKLITKRDLDKALDIQKKSGGSLGRILVEQGYISEEALMLVMSRQLNMPPINLSKYKVDKKLTELIPEKIAKHYNLIPISSIGNVLTVAMADPFNIFAIDDIKMLTKYKIDPVIATENDIKGAINTYYGTHGEEVSKILEGVTLSDIEVVEEEEHIDVSEITQESQQAPIVTMVSLILNEAMQKRASDIHIEPCERSLRVRYRIDGNLHDVLTLPKKNQNAVLVRLKIMSKLDITETRLPQDGRFKINFQGKEIDFRVSALPIAFGGKIVLRVLDKSSLNIGLEQLGFLPGPLSAFKTALARPYGMILVTGPTGSGKSTTLYSVITQLNSPELNIVTLEEPVEYELEGITQIQAKPEIGLTFANGLKSVLRQSPDIIMVGEIRDFETADIAIKASLTGQLLLSTLHTNDAAGAITRLVDMGVEPFLVASRKNVLDRVGLNLDEIGKKGKKGFYKGKGCQHCNETGYYGRLGILEALLIDDQIREMIVKKVSSDEIKAYGLKHGMKTLRENALENFVNGVTSLEEVLRVTSED